MQSNIGDVARTCREQFEATHGDGGLVLKRKTSEGVIIGDDIHVCIAEVRGDSVRLHVNAPKSVRIVRDELPYVDGAHAACAEGDE